MDSDPQCYILMFIIFILLFVLIGIMYNKESFKDLFDGSIIGLGSMTEPMYGSNCKEIILVNDKDYDKLISTLSPSVSQAPVKTYEPANEVLRKLFAKVDRDMISKGLYEEFGGGLGKKPEEKKSG
jgi:hypothetical protein